MGTLVVLPDMRLDLHGHRERLRDDAVLLCTLEDGASSLEVVRLNGDLDRDREALEREAGRRAIENARRRVAPSEDLELLARGEDVEGREQAEAERRYEQVLR